MIIPVFFKLLMQLMDIAFFLAEFNAGRRIPARIAMIAIVITNTC